MSQYSRGYESQSPMGGTQSVYTPGQSQTGEAQPVYAPEPIDLQQVEYQRSYQGTQQPLLQQQIPPQQYRPQSMAYPTYMYPMYVQPVFVYPRNGPDAPSRIASVLSYIGGWFSALLVLLFVRKNRFVRFHALQSLFLFGGMNLIYIAFFRIASFWTHTLGFWHAGRPLFLILVLAFVLLNIIVGISWFVGIVGAMIGKKVKLPFVGNLVERLTGGPVPL